MPVNSSDLSLLSAFHISDPCMPPDLSEAGNAVGSEGSVRRVIPMVYSLLNAGVSVDISCYDSGILLESGWGIVMVLIWLWFFVGVIGMDVEMIKVNILGGSHIY